MVLHVLTLVCTCRTGFLYIGKGRSLTLPGPHGIHFSSGHIFPLFFMVAHRVVLDWLARDCVFVRGSIQEMGDAGSATAGSYMDR